MKVKIGLIDYDMGNLKSVSKALEKVGARVRMVEKPSQIKGVSALVLPGVGAFGVAVKNLKKRKLFGAVRDWIGADKSFLGICLGYQLLYQTGLEGGKKENGLGIFKGSVQRFPRAKNLKVPHMGWNQIQKTSQVSSLKSQVKSANGIFNEIPDGSYFYFVHSYFPVPKDKKIVATNTKYGGDFASSIAWGKSFACQFHPEKSGENGLKLLRNFVREAASC